MKNSTILKNKSGFSLIDVLFFISIFTIASMAFYRTIGDGTRVALDAKYRLGALALANERMEIIRNMQYDDIGTIGGIPNGTLLESESVLASGKTYQVTTLVKTDDDPFDGVSPADGIPEDFKLVRVTVAWGDVGSNKNVNLTARFVPPGLEAETGDGVLAVNVIDGTGAGVSQAQVNLINNDITPQVNVTSNTNNEGKLTFPGAKQSIQKYQLTVSKSGYETVSTIDPATVAYNHIDVHASVVSGLLNTKSIVIDRLADLTIKSLDYTGAVLAGVDFHLKGGRVLGTDNTVVPSVLVYILDVDETTDSDGEFSLDNHSPGQFFVSAIDNPSGYTLIGLSPVGAFDPTSNTYALSLLPNASQEVEMKFAKNDVPSVLVKVSNEADGLPINGAKVRLSDGGSYNVEVTTSVDGVAFFPTDATPLVAGDYNLQVSADGLETDNSSLNNLDGFVISEVGL